MDEYDQHIHQNTLSKSMIDKNIDEKECKELKKINKHYLSKRKYFMKSTEISYQEKIGGILGKDSHTTDQTIKLNNVLALIRCRKFFV